MNKLSVFFLGLIFSIVAISASISCESRGMRQKGANVNTFGWCRGRGLGRGGRFRDGSGPNPDCPLKQDQKENEQSGRKLKRDGTGPNRDGRGPRGTDIGPKEDCPNK